jgi:hypothetical protein
MEELRQCSYIPAVERHEDVLIPDAGDVAQSGKGCRDYFKGGVDIILTSIKFLRVILAHDAKGATMKHGHANPWETGGHAGHELLGEERLTDAAIAIKCGDDAARNPVSDDPLALDGLRKPCRRIKQFKDLRATGILCGGCCGSLAEVWDNLRSCSIILFIRYGRLGLCLPRLMED